MRNTRRDVVEKAIEVLDAHGLADLSMRRLGAELGVRPSALYHHVENKQVLLAAVADELLARGPQPEPSRDWAERVASVCTCLRDAMLAYRDGAELVATVHAFGLGARAPYDALVADLSPLAARTLLHFVFGHVVDEQTHLQAGSVGAIADGPRESSDFALGLAIVLDGIRSHREAGHQLR